MNVNLDEGGNGDVVHVQAARLAAGLRLAGRLVADWLFPPHCLVCDAPISAHPGLCVECWRQMVPISSPQCDVLGLPFEIDLGPGAKSAEALADPPHFDRARAAVVYNEMARAVITPFKYADRIEIATFMASVMARPLMELADRPSVLVPIPLHRARQRQRRYNQSALIARALSKTSGLDVRYDLVTRSRPTRQQVGLSGPQRRRNVQGAFAVRAEAVQAINGRQVILVDDVFTTGSTSNEVARVLRHTGVGRICVLSFARVVPGTHDMTQLDI